MSGRTRASRSTKRTLTSTVAFERSTVGTMRDTTAARRVSGSASSCTSQGWSTAILPMLDSATSASTSRVSMSATVTTAPFASAAEENGVMLSPTLAFLVRTMASNGARISVCSTPTSAARRFASADATPAFCEAIAARALPSRATSASCCAPEMNFFASSSFERLKFASASRSSAAPCCWLAIATLTCASACASVACTSLRSSRAITSPALTREPSSTPNHSSRPVAFEESAALRCGTT
jgi:hypothetical protein